MKVSRANAFLIIALCVLFFILAYQTVSSPGTRQSSDSLAGSEKHKSPKSSHTPQKHKKKHSPSPQPQKGEKENPNIEYLIWTGIEISDDNPLYFPYRDLSIALECEQIANFPRNTFLFSSKLLSYFEKWIPKVGYNRIIDCLVARSVDISSKDLHQIGVALVQYYELHQDKITPRHLIEVNTRNLLNHAPLHGVVWGLIELQGIEDKENLFNYLDDLCYFQDDPTMGDIWISCVHGIGHAFADLFGYERLSEAIDLCDYHDDHDWKYSCATGAYMVYSKDKHWPEFGTSNSPAVTHWEPCDSEKFPAACFRFKKSDTFEEKAYPCQRFSNLRDTYRLRGCIWAHGFNLGKDNSIKKARDLCDLYGEQVPPNSMKSPELEDYLSCLDGFYHNSFWLEGEKKFTKSCQSLPFPEATDLCMRYASVDRFQYNALEHPWWNWELLEEL